MKTDTAVLTTKGIIDLNYALISGKAGEPRDWETWRHLHAPGARLIPIEGDQRIARVMSPDEYIESRTPFFEKTSFYEIEIDRQEVQLGRLAQVWSRYVAMNEPDGEIIRRGANSIQLWNDGKRWWILSVAWDAVEALNV